MITTKGEAIALAIAQMSTVELASCDHGTAAKVKRCIMERDLYPKRWGLGNTAVEKKKMKSEGKLDKYGRPNEATPAKWVEEYKDFNAPAADGTTPAPVAQITATEEAEKEEVSADVDVSMISVDDDAGKKRKRHEGETAEEKAERKRKKKEKKEKKAKKSGGKVEDSDSD